MLISFSKYINYKFKNKELKLMAKNNRYKFVKKFIDNINLDYLKELCEDKNNKILIYSISNDLNFRNFFGIIIYRKILDNKFKKRIYLSLISLHKKVRGLGYGKIILEEIKNKFKKENQELELILLSLKSSKSFYLKNGFELNSTKFLEKHSQSDCIKMVMKI